MSFLSSLFNQYQQGPNRPLNLGRTIGSMFSNQTRQLPNDSGSYQSPVISQANQNAFNPAMGGTPSPLARPATPTPSPSLVRGGASTPRPTQRGSGQQSGLSPEDLAYMGNLVRNTQLSTQGDIGNFAQNVFSNENPSSMDARADMGRLENTQMDLATGETDPYEWASESGIPYSPQELNAIEKAMAGVYDPALETAKARYERAMRMEEEERSATLKSKSSGSGGGLSGSSSGDTLDNLNISQEARNIIDLVNKGTPINELIKGSGPAIQKLRNEVYAGLAAQGGYTEQAMDLFRDGVRVAQDFLDNEDYNKLGGFAAKQRGALSPKYGDAKNRANQLVAILAKDTLGLMKGVLTDRDIEFLKSMATGFADEGMVTKEYVKNTMEQIQNKLRNRLGENTNNVSDSSGDPEYDQYLQSIGAI